MHSFLEKMHTSWHGMLDFSWSEPRLLLPFFLVTYLFLRSNLQWFWTPWHSGHLSSLFLPPSLCTLPLLPRMAFFFCLHPPFLFCLLLMSAHFLGLDLNMIRLCQSSISLHSSACILYNSYLRCITIIYILNSLGLTCWE